MTLFDDREHSFEKKFALDSELQFKAQARRNRKLGLWAAGLLGKHGEEAENYAQEVIASDFEEAGDGDVERKILNDAAKAGIDLSLEALRQKMAAFLREAQEEFKKS